MTDEQQHVLNENEMRDLVINAEVAQQALDQTRERAQYALDMRHRIEVRAATLLRTFLSLALAIVGFGFATARLSGSTDVSLLPLYVLGALPLFAGAACMVGAIWDRDYATLGGPAHWWLREHVIDGDKSEATYLNVCLAASYDRRGEKSIESNNAALRWIRRGVVAAALTPLFLCLPAVL